MSVSVPVRVTPEVRARYQAVIGLEVHAQLLTRSKAFSPDSAAFGGAPNTHTDPVSLGHPGTLPVLNREVVTFSVRMGMATNCTIAERSVFARKHYFYPDLPKGYQISQYDRPICTDGWLDVLVATSEGDGEAGPRVHRVGISRIHMEEDAGKSMHDQDPYASLVDYNRCGVPLIEIVSEPDMHSPAEAGAYLRRIRQIVRYLGICDGNMEEGSLRCDANVSVRPVGQASYGTKAEVKNLNSIRNVERAIAFEIERQIGIAEGGGEVVQETRLWDAAQHATRSMRSKEEAHDYRYFPDPDLPPVAVNPALLDEIRAGLPEMPEVRRRRFVEDLDLPDYDAGVLTEERAVADYFEAALQALSGRAVVATSAKAVSNFVMGDVLRVANELSIDVSRFPVSPDRLAALIAMRQEDRISSSAATQIFDAMLHDPSDPETLALECNLLQISDAGALEPVVKSVIEGHPAQVEAYLGGKEGLIGFFVGQVMRTFPGAPDPRLVRELLQAELEARRS
jgi:aspartyl-tRNA(Asn)/glutamyl-tRNA(Gln) amidotransferase subunit B